jgi:hypothetical protein
MAVWDVTCIAKVTSLFKGRHLMSSCLCCRDLGNFIIGSFIVELCSHDSYIWQTFVTCVYLPCCMNNALVLILATCPPLSDYIVTKVKWIKWRHVMFPWLVGLVYAWQAGRWLVSGQYHSLCWVVKCSGCGNTAIQVTMWTVGKCVWIWMFGQIKKLWEEYDSYWCGCLCTAQIRKRLSRTSLVVMWLYCLVCLNGGEESCI